MRLQITDCIARDSEHYAQSVANKFLKVAKQIPEQPLIGRVVPEVKREDIREQFVYSYRLIYGVSDTSIPIIAIIHGSRLLLENIGDRFDSVND